MLHHDGDIGDDNAGVIGFARDRRRVVQIIEAKVKGTLGWHCDPIGPDRVAVFVIEVISTCASESFAFSMHAVSWLVMAGSGPVLVPGM